METEAGDTMTFSIAATESMLPDGRMATRRSPTRTSPAGVTEFCLARSA